MEIRHARQERERPLVLFVDDDVDTCEMYTIALATMGFDTMLADDVATAHSLTCRLQPDVVVTDLALPRVDGWTLIHQLKRDLRTRDIPIVIVSGHAQSSVRDRARTEGCAAFLIKPCLPDQLALRLRELLAPNVANEPRETSHHPQRA